MTKPVELSEIIGGYVLERVLGRGGMGTVFLGKHRLLGRAAAVKVLDAEMAENEQLVSRFFHEAKIVNDVRHPNIVDVIDFVRTENPRRVAFIMEYLEGDPLDRHLKEKGPLPAAHAINVVLQILDGLSAVHAIGAIHRDLKPANLRFTTKALGDCSAVPIIKVLDFGIAKAASPMVAHKTQTGIVLGTPAYMAPEQVSGEAVSSRSDVYAVGEILYELIGGQRLFTGTNTQVLRAKLAAQPPELHFPEGIPHARELSDVVRSCLALEAEHRPSTEALIASLEALRPRLATGPVPVGFEEAVKPTAVSQADTPAPMNTLAGDQSLYGAARPDQPDRRLVAIFGLLLVVLAGAAIFFATRSEEPIVVRSIDDSVYVKSIEPPPPPPPPPAAEVVEAPPVDEPVAIAEPEEKKKPAKKKKRKKERRHRAAAPRPPVAPPPAQPVKTAPKKELGRIKVTAWTTAGRQVPAKVTIDGRPVDRAAPLEVKARAGRRKVTVEAVGHPPKTRDVVVEDGEVTNVDVVVDLR